MTIYCKLELIREKRGTVAIALLDPDTKNDYGLNKPDINFQKPDKQDDADYDENSFNMRPI